MNYMDDKIPATNGQVQVWHKEGERQFTVGRNATWSIWQLLEYECAKPANITYNISIEALPDPETCIEIHKGSECRQYYTDIALPNPLGSTNQQNIVDMVEFNNVYLARGRKCHQNLEVFGCHFLYPKCTQGTADNKTTVQIPCKQFCEEITNVCSKKFGTGGLLPLLRLKCPLLPNPDEDPKCIHPPVNCGAPPRNETISGGGKWTYEASTAGNKATFYCPPGLDTVGTTEIRCQFTGEWTTSEAKCVDNRGLYAAIGSSLIIIALLLITVPLVYKWRYEINVLIYNRFQFRFRRQNEQGDKIFDAFISYNVKVHI